MPHDAGRVAGRRKVMKINKKYPACPVALEDGTGVNPARPPGGLILSKKNRQNQQDSLKLILLDINSLFNIRMSFKIEQHFYIAIIIPCSFQKSTFKY